MNRGGWEPTEDDWQWFSATGRRYRIRPALEMEADEFAFVPDDAPHIKTVIRRFDMALAVLAFPAAASWGDANDAEMAAEFDVMLDEALAQARE